LFGDVALMSKLITDIVHGRKNHVAVFSMLFLLCVVNVAYGYAQTQSYHTGDAVPGNVNNGIQGLGRVFKLIQIYRGRHSGAYPVSPGDVLRDMVGNLQSYGFDDISEMIDTLYNPDNQYDDNPSIRLNP
jgi:hypothetical protein